METSERKLYYSRYPWYYGIFHWFVHYFLTIMLVAISGIVIIPIFLPYTLFGIYMKNNIVDHFIVIVISSLIDLDHLPILKKFGFRRYLFAEKRIVTPLHNFFVLSVLAIISALSAIFISKALAVVIFSVALHLIWDMIEDVFIFRTTFRRWEKTWGLDAKDLEDAYNELIQFEALQPKKESRIKRISSKLRERGAKLKERIRRKKVAPVTQTPSSQTQ